MRILAPIILIQCCVAFCDGTRPKEFMVEAHRRAVWCVVISPDGRMLASGSGDGLRVWDLSTIKERIAIKGEVQGSQSIAFSVDSELLAVQGLIRENPAQRMNIWEVKTGKLRATIALSEPYARHVVFGPDGKTLAIALTDGLAEANEHKVLKLIDVDTGKETASLKAHEGETITSLAFSPDGRLLATGGFDRRIRLWDTASGKLLNKLEGHKVLIYSVAFSRDGQFIVSGGAEALGNPPLPCAEVKVWDVATRKEILSIKGVEPKVGQVGTCCDGRVMLALVDMGGMIRFWDSKTGQELATFEDRNVGKIGSFAISRDGETLFVGFRDGTLASKRIGSILGRNDKK